MQRNEPILIRPKENKRSLRARPPKTILSLQHLVSVRWSMRKLCLSALSVLLPLAPQQRRIGPLVGHQFFRRTYHRQSLCILGRLGSSTHELSINDSSDFLGRHLSDNRRYVFHIARDDDPLGLLLLRTQSAGLLSL